MEFGRSTTRFICFELKNSVLMFVLWFASVWKKIFFHWPLAKSLNQGSTAGGRSGVTHPDRGARSAATWIPGGQPPQGLSNVMLPGNTNSSQCRHNEHDGDSNHQPYNCLLNRLFRRRSKKTSKLRVTGLCEGNSPVAGKFPAQRVSDAENVSIWWRHHELRPIRPRMWMFQCY